MLRRYVMVTKLPMLILYLFLQEEKFIKHVDGLKQMLAQYHAVLSSLNLPEVRLLWNKELFITLRKTCWISAIYVFFFNYIAYIVKYALIKKTEHRHGKLKVELDQIISFNLVPNDKNIYYCDRANVALLV